MAYVVYCTSDSRIVTEKRYGKETYATESAAKAARTRMLKKPRKVNGELLVYKPEDLAVQDLQAYRMFIEQTVERVNLMTGKTFRESVNTPYYCSPSSETYWSM
jgi:hypothetical protein